MNRKLLEENRRLKREIWWLKRGIQKPTLIEVHTYTNDLWASLAYDRKVSADFYKGAEFVSKNILDFITSKDGK